MDAQWQALIARWRRENPAFSRHDAVDIERYRVVVQRRLLLWRLHWHVSKAATALTFVFAAYWMLTAFSAAGLAIALSLCAVAMTATLANDPRHLGLLGIADLHPSDYLARQRAAVVFSLRSVASNAMVYALLAAILLVMQPGHVPMLAGGGLATRWVWLAMAASLLVDLWRWRRARDALRRLDALAPAGASTGDSTD